MKGLEYYKNEWNFLWEKYLETDDVKTEIKIQAELKHLLEDMANHFGVSTSVAFNWIWSE